MNFQRLNTSDEVRDLIEFHSKHSRFCVVDVETTSKKSQECGLIDIQLTGRTRDSVVIFSGEHRHVLNDFPKTTLLVAHNYKFDAHVLYRHGVDLLSYTWRDTLLLSHLLDENRESYSLGSFVKEYWNDNFKEEFWSKYKSYQEAPKDEADEYACKDVYYTGELFQRQLVMADESGINNYLIEHVHRLQNCLLRTEISGVAVDRDYITDLGVRLKHRLGELKPQMRSLVEDAIENLELRMWELEMSKRKTDKGRARVKRPEFSFESTKQLQDLLYGELELPKQFNEKTKQISTDYESLQKIKDDHPVVALIQEHREINKVYTAYVIGTLERLRNERIYPEFRVAGTVTGRLSHSNPNLAQLPKSGGVRGIYVPDPGRVFISADYSQLEVIVEANLTSDPNLIRMLENGESKHDLTARELGCSRDSAKTLNFAMQYHCSHFKVAKLLGCSNAEGLTVWNKYWEVYSGAKTLKAKTDKMVDQGIPLVNWFGRRRRFRVGPRKVWDSDYRQAYNFLIQSNGSDITSKAFYEVSEQLTELGIGKTMWSVHDEIIIEAVKEHAATAEELLKSTMEGQGKFLGLKVPLKAQTSGPCVRWED